MTEADKQGKAIKHQIIYSNGFRDASGHSLKINTLSLYIAAINLSSLLERKCIMNYIPNKVYSHVT